MLFDSSVCIEFRCDKFEVLESRHSLIDTDTCVNIFPDCRLTIWIKMDEYPRRISSTFQAKWVSKLPSLFLNFHFCFLFVSRTHNSFRTWTFSEHNCEMQDCISLHESFQKTVTNLIMVHLFSCDQRLCEQADTFIQNYFWIVVWFFWACRLSLLWQFSFSVYPKRETWSDHFSVPHCGVGSRVPFYLPLGSIIQSSIPQKY